MTRDLETRKQNILEHLAEVNDEYLIEQIEHLLIPKVDFWDTLSETSKSSINKGLDDLDAGRRVPYNDFVKKYA